MTWRSRRHSFVLATLTGLLLATVIGAPASAATSAPIIAGWRVAPGAYELDAGLGAMWAANVDEFHDGQIYRIDATTGSITLVTTLPIPLGGMTFAFRSIWVSDYYGNSVWRIAPDGRVQAVFPTGLQPLRVHAAFGSIWVANHHGSSLTRIDPTSSTVIDTVPVGEPHRFRNGPQDFTADATRLYVGSSNLFKLQAVDPVADSVTTPERRAGNDGFCGDLQAIDGFVWSADQCSQAAYRLSTDGTVQQVLDASPGNVTSLTVLDREVWIAREPVIDPATGQASHGVLDERDPRNGHLLRTVGIGGDPWTVRSAFGDLWVFDARRHSVLRVHP